MEVLVDGGLAWCAVILLRVGLVSDEAWWNDRPVKRRFEENVLRIVGPDLKPTRIVKGACIQTDETWKALKAQKDLGAANCAEIHVDNLATAFRSVVEDGHAPLQNAKVLFSEDWFDKDRGSSGTLAKTAVAGGHTNGIG